MNYRTGSHTDDFRFGIDAERRKIVWQSKATNVNRIVGVGRETILAWIAKRNMPAYKVGRLWKFKLSEVDDRIRSGGASDDNAQRKDGQNFE